MAATQLSTRAIRDAAPDLSAEAVNLLVRERAILELARHGFSREESKRLLFEAWRIRRFGLDG